MTTVSIAMCTYNGAEFLQQQLDSLVQQTHRPDEIIICDDASSDNSLEISLKFARQQVDIKVNVIKNQKNLGYVKNFEKAISLCNCDLIFLCDQDDVWHSEKISQIVTVFDTDTEVGLVLHDFCWIDENNFPYPGPVDTYGPKKISSLQLPQEIKKHSIEVFMQPYPRAWCGCMMAYRRNFNDLILPIFPGKGHDDWILKILAPVTETRFVANPLVQYRMHQKNTNRRDLKKRTMHYLLNRFFTKSILLIKGHTKRGFYREIMHRLKTTSRIKIYKNLLYHYQNYAKIF